MKRLYDVSIRDLKISAEYDTEERRLSISGDGLNECLVVQLPEEMIGLAISSVYKMKSTWKDKIAPKAKEIKVVIKRIQEGD